MLLGKLEHEQTTLTVNYGWTVAEEIPKSPRITHRVDTSVGRYSAIFVADEALQHGAVCIDRRSPALFLARSIFCATRSAGVAFAVVHGMCFSLGRPVVLREVCPVPRSTQLQLAALHERDTLSVSAEGFRPPLPESAFFTSFSRHSFSIDHHEPQTERPTKIRVKMPRCSTWQDWPNVFPRVAQTDCIYGQWCGSIVSQQSIFFNIFREWARNDKKRHKRKESWDKWRKLDPIFEHTENVVMWISYERKERIRSNQKTSWAKTLSWIDQWKDREMYTLTEIRSSNRSYIKLTRRSRKRTTWTSEM